MNQDPSGPDRIIQSLRVCRDEIKHEYDVLSGRLSSYITSQAFLVSGYAVSMNSPQTPWGTTYRFYFPMLLSLIGIVLSMRSYPGISGACRVIQHWHYRQKELFETGGAILDDYSVLREERVRQIHDNNLWFAKTSPWVFGLTWTLIGILTVYIRSVS